eukprot:5194058-Prorocentrum_lima.AAC.1
MHSERRASTEAVGDIPCWTEEAVGNVVVVPRRPLSASIGHGDAYPSWRPIPPVAVGNICG